jgi:hypothetical protein
LASAFSRFFSEQGGIQSLLDAQTPQELMQAMLDAAESGQDSVKQQKKGG